MPKTDGRERILVAAEKRVRRVGFSNMSFRDIATDVGVKSASVHYHFPTKTDLGEALIDAYADRFLRSLTAIDQSDVNNAIKAFIKLYNDALVLNQSICLCAMMSAEAMGLSASLNTRLMSFFRSNLTWLEELFEQHFGDRKAALSATIISALEGAMIVAAASDDRLIFDQVSESILNSVHAECAQLS
ncbi:MAG: TetR/AcrR family transcriptional regulator [Pseudomonadota bacterium]